jgi:SSS family solute:Na+ symporter
VTQFFPGVLLGLFSRRVTTSGVFAGMVAGVIVVAILMLSKHDPVFGLNAGFVGLCLNFLIVGVLAIAKSPRKRTVAAPSANSAR